MDRNRPHSLIREKLDCCIFKRRVMAQLSSLRNNIGRPSKFTALVFKMAPEREEGTYEREER